MHFYHLNAYKCNSYLPGTLNTFFLWNSRTHSSICASQFGAIKHFYKKVMVCRKPIGIRTPKDPGKTIH